MTEMSKRERVQATLMGEVADRVPISIWGHFPNDPHRAEDLAAATIENQRRYDWDFVKMMPSGMYYPEALGCTLTPALGPRAVNELSDSVIKQPEDWERLPVLDPTTGWLAEHVRSIRLVREALGPDVPILQTLFSPLTIAHKLSLHLPFAESVHEHRPRLEAGLRAILEGSKRFAAATLEAGADGFFFATQEANRDTLDEADFLALGKRYDRELLDAIGDRASFLLLHVCRENIHADLVADYPVQAINWEVQKTRPSLSEARNLWGQTLVGGIDRFGPLRNGTPEQVRAEVRQVLAEAGPGRLIVSAGCAIPTDCPPANLRAARAALD